MVPAWWSCDPGKSLVPPDNWSWVKIALAPWQHFFFHVPVKGGYIYGEGHSIVTRPK